jgi:hypothetical protein
LEIVVCQDVLYIWYNSNDGGRQDKKIRRVYLKIEKDPHTCILYWVAIHWMPMSGHYGGT